MAPEIHLKGLRNEPSINIFSAPSNIRKGYLQKYKPE